MGHYDDYYSASEERRQKERENSLIQEAKDGTLYNLVKTAIITKNDHITIDRYRFELMLTLLKRMDG